jgi:hypothetical protein
VAAYVFNSADELDDMTHFAYRLQICLCYLVLHLRAARSLLRGNEYCLRGTRWVGCDVAYFPEGDAGDGDFRLNRLPLPAAADGDGLGHDCCP